MYRYGWTLPSLLLLVFTLGACQPVTPIESDSPINAGRADSTPDTGSTSWDEIFVIGTFDDGSPRFSYDRVDQYQEYVCRIGVDCSDVDIPRGLCGRDEVFGCDSYDIPKLTVEFELARDYNELMLHLERAGSETTAVSVDGEEPLLVTSEMLGSRDGGVDGSYDLVLGPLQSGSHSVSFTVHDDRKGNRRYHWNQLSLSAR